MQRTIILSVLGLGFASAQAQAQSIEWDQPVDGLWSNPANWAGGNVPDDEGESVILGFDSPYSVTLQSGENVSIGALSLENPLATLNVSNAGGHSRLLLHADVVNNGVINLNDQAGDNGDQVGLTINESLTIGGTGTIWLRVKEGDDLYDAFLATNAELTLGGSQTLSGSGTLIAVSMIVNNGVIDPGMDGAFLRAYGNFSGDGVYRASAGTLDLANGLLTATTIDSSGTGRVGAITGTPTLTDVHNLGTLTMTNINANLNGSYERFMVVRGSMVNDGIIEVRDETDAVGGFSELYIPYNTVINGDGAIELLAQAGDELSNAKISVQQFVTLTIGPDQSITGSGVIGESASIPGLGTFMLNGTVAPGGSHRLIEIQPPIFCDTTTVFNFDLGGALPGEYDRVRLTGAMQLMGSLVVGFDEGYTPQLGDRWVLIEGGDQTGMFQSVSIEPAPAGRAYRVFTTPGETVLVLTCLADLNGDMGLDFFDISDFLTYFMGTDARADLNEDGEFNFFDVSAFLVSYKAGCAG